ncbi:MAG: hypothetical protein H7A21_09755 [Spirochaetales bacterium]|nr:hypothetical protein [Leptospiraceae bacterium]MCP5481707.1 hypothetical protein [Spirochaetales bacterium]
MRPALSFWPAAVLLLTLILFCRPADTTVPLEDAYSEIGAAISFKANECGHQPGYPLLIPANPPEYGIRLCSLLIIRQDCPFRDYPLACIELYADICDFCDVPGLDP